MELEWDERKRQNVLAGRGLDFADVVLIDPASLQTWEDRRADYGEKRFMSCGYLSGRLCTFC